MVDLRSDTVTRPTPEMRRAMAEAEVGDDVLGDDPTVARLEQRIADILDKEASLFFPSGIMANQAALMCLAQPHSEAVCEASCHIFDWELGGAAANAGVQLRTVAAPGGLLTAELMAEALRPRSALQLNTSVVCLENTHNGAGGRVLPLASMRAIHTLARSRGLSVHLDGARLWNAAAASGVTEAEFAACADTVMVTLSKGLGCPVGSMLAASGEVIARARIIRRRLGGAMRQAGIIAAAGLHALDHHRERLQEDHQRARMLARLAAHVPHIRVLEPETNIVMFDVLHPQLTAADVVEGLGDRGVLLVPFAERRVRAVTHLDVDDDDVRLAASAMAEFFAHA